MFLGRALEGSLGSRGWAGWLVTKVSPQNGGGGKFTPPPKPRCLECMDFMKTYMSQVEKWPKNELFREVLGNILEAGASGICATGSKLPFFPYKRLECTRCRDFRH